MSLLGRFAAVCQAILVLALSSWTCAAESDPASEAPRLKIGVTEFALSDDRVGIMNALDKALVSVRSKYRVDLAVYSVPVLEERAREGKVGLVLGSAGLVRRLTDIGVKTIVSSVGPGAVDANQNEGSAFIVRRSRNDLQSLKDLQGSVMAANRPTGFSGYLIALGEIAMAGHDPERFFANRIFFGEQSASQRIARAVISGAADVGILKLCAWEGLTASMPGIEQSLRVLAPVKSSSACLHSTKLYPAHTLAALPHVSPQAVTDLTLAFLEMPKTEEGRSWAVATDFLSVDRLYRALKMGPYAYLRESVLTRFFYEYKALILTLLFAAAVVLLQLIHTRRLLEKRTRQVKDLAQKESEQEKRLLFLERNTTVSQLSSMIAHELHQPLAAIRLYARGLARLAVRRSADADEREVIDSIAEEASRAKEIVERVRLYAKNRRPPREEVALSTLIQSAVSHFEASTLANDAGRMTVLVPEFEDCRVRVAALEMELVFLNVLKNARDAAAKSVRIRVEFPAQEAGVVTISFVDDGPDADEKTLERLSASASSQKPEGLGLGLGIARSIVEQHAGKIFFKTNSPDAGLTVVVLLPLMREAL